MKRKSLTLRIVIGVIITVLIGGGAYLFEDVTKVQGSQSGQLVPVVEGDKIVAYVDSGAVGQLGTQEKELQGGQSAAKEGASLDFVLGSAGIVNYEKVGIDEVGDSDNSRILSREEAKKVVLKPNEDRTVALIDPQNGDDILISVVGKLYITNN